MKIFTYLLVLVLGMGPHFSPLAHASSSNGNANTPQNGSNKNCHGSGVGYGGGSLNHCNKTDNQQNSQGDTEDLNNQGAQQSSSMGTMAMAAGAAMIAAGMSTSPPNGALIAAGAALLAAGMAAMQAAAKMANNAGKAGYNFDTMSGITTGPDPIKDAQIGQGSGDSKIKIDPTLLRDQPKSAAIFDDFEQKTGLSRDEFAKALEEGRSPAEILAHSKKMGMSQADLEKTLAANAAAGAAMSAGDVMNKLGLTPEELAAMSKNTSMGDDGAYGAGGGSRAPASTNGNSSLDALLGGGASGAAGAGTFGAEGGAKLSPDVQAALDRNGITNRSLFQMVNEQYRKKTPMLFGVPRAPNSDSTFGGLGGRADL